MKSRLPVAVIAAAISGCAVHQSAPEPIAASLGRYHFDYTLQNRDRSHVSQVFDDGQQTFIAISGSSDKRLLIATSEDGAALPYSRSGMYVVIAGLHRRLFITSPQGTTIAANNSQAGPAGPAAAPSPAPQATASQPADPEILAARGALQLARQEIADLRVQLAKARAAQAPGTEAATIQGRIARLEALSGEANAVIVRVEFGRGSIDFQPSDEVADALVKAAKEASHVTLRAFTDARLADESNKRIALARALTARRFLINAGVPAKKIRAFYQSAGGFIADNATPEGRAKNRRVEIQIAPEPSKLALLVGGPQ